MLTQAQLSIVVAVRENNSATQPFLFRTYEHLASAVPDPFELNPGLPTQAPIWQVARATTAAPTYFKPLVIGNEKFLDGGFGIANNPTWHALLEVGQMSSNSHGAVALTVSIGTGKADKVPPVAKRGAGLLGRYKAIIKYSAATATDSEATHLKMEDLSRRTGHHYERFNVDGGLGNIDLGEWTVRGGRNLTLEKIEQQTRAYLERSENRARLRRVAEILVKNRQERSRHHKWDIVATGHRYRCPVDKCMTTLFTREEDLKMHLVELHGDLGYVRPAKTPSERSKMAKAVRLGKILHAD
jgi:predicted acylesterase/phospholipase RssA